jgi:adenylate cyclase
MLARLYSLNYSLELFDRETPLEKAVAFAERGVKRDPANQRVRMIMAFILLFKNELSAGLAEVDRALQLNPNSLIILENIGYLMTLFGDWERGPALINQAIEQNPYYNITSFITHCGSIGSARKNTSRHTGKPYASTGPCSSGIRC